jgi:hypothetical protein
MKHVAFHWAPLDPAIERTGKGFAFVPLMLNAGCAVGGARGGRFLVLQHEPAPRAAHRAAQQQ